MVLAHSLRLLSTSVALLKNIPIFEICKAANWFSVHIFSKRYMLLHSSRSDAPLKNTVLSLVLDSALKLPSSVEDTARKSPEVKDI